DQTDRPHSGVNVSTSEFSAVWSVRATHSKSGKPLIRECEETITFNAEGRVTRVDVTDYQEF
ncbi:hypothetical protein ACCT21_34660, partial [Rhizobium brockwellii]